MCESSCDDHDADPDFIPNYELSNESSCEDDSDIPNDVRSNDIYDKTNSIPSCLPGKVSEKNCFANISLMHIDVLHSLS